MSKLKITQAEVGLFAFLCIAITIVFLLLNQEPTIEGDAIYYLLPIHNLAQGHGYSYLGEPHTFYSPGYGLLAYLVYLVIGDVEASGILISVIGYLLSIVLAFTIAQYLFGQRAGLVAAFFVTFAPFLVQLAAYTLTEPIYSAFYLLSFFLYLKIVREDKNSLWYGTLGLALGMSYLIRPEAFLTGVLVILSLLVLAFMPSKGQVKLPKALTAAVCFILVLTPYIWFLHDSLGKWTIAGKTSATMIYYGEMFEGVSEIDLKRHQEADPAYFEQGVIDYVRLRGFDLLPRLKQNFVWVNSEMIGIIRHALVGLVVLVGVTFALGKIRLKAWQDSIWQHWQLPLAVLIFLSPIAGLLLFFIIYRFLTPYSLVVLILLAGLFEALLQQLDERLSPKTQTALCYSVMLMGFVSLLSPFPFFKSLALDTIMQTPNAYAYTREVGNWLHEHVEMKDKTIMGIGKLHIISFYANGKNVPLNQHIEIPPDLPLEAVSTYMADHHVDYLVLEGDYMRARPQFQPLWDHPEKAADYGLIPLYADPDDPSFQVYALL